MTDSSLEKSFENQLASLKMEGYTYSNQEISNIKKCLNGELTFQQFANNLIQELKEQ